MPASPAKTFLITAASGHIGTELLPLLHSSCPDLNLVLPTTNAAKLKASLPSPLASDSHITLAEGHIQDPEWFQDLVVSHNVDTVFLCLTGQDELFTTMNCLDSMVRSKTVQRLIYLSACGDRISQEGLSTVMSRCSAAHVLVKSTVELKLLHTDLPFEWTVIGPTLFFTNDIRSKRSMLEHGMFDEPLGEKGVSKVCPTDIALAVRNVALSNSGSWNRKKVMIGSKRAFTGAEVADLWSKALGKEIKMYGSGKDDLDRFEREFGARIPHGHVGKAWGRDLRLMYELFAEMKFGMSDEEYALQVELLGKEPEDYVDWVGKIANLWQD